jgi:toluene monooxygenase system protein A
MLPRRLRREEFEDIVRDVDWTLSYLDDEAVFPEWQSGSGKVPREAWASWEEAYKVTYPEYVATQREKEAGAWAVKAALSRSHFFEECDEGWKSIVKAHFGAVNLAESAGQLGELRMARFGLAAPWRNMAVLGALDEIRHAQLMLALAHDFVAHDPQFDWAQKAYHTNNWAIIAARTLFDAMILSGNVVDVALQLPFTFETGFTNLQFLALAADALEVGDVNFANMISSIQTDEARHAQQGGPTLEILAEHDPDRAQWTLDRQFWVSARLFAILTGPAMDYYTPLGQRKQSYREFMEEWIIDQHGRILADYGLRKPWYWDELLVGLEHWHHSLHMGLWYWRPTLWWRPAAGVSKADREWLAEKYPDWESIYGPLWDTIIDNVNAGRMEATCPETLPWLCNLCHLPVCTFAASPYDGQWRVRNYSLTHNGYTYHFCSKPCRQIWWEDKDSMHHQTVVERLLAGQIQPPDLSGILTWMGLTPEVMGDDGGGYRWADEYKDRVRADERNRAPRVSGRTGAGTPGTTAPNPVPVNALFGSDFVSQLVLLMSNDTVSDAARRVAHHAVGRRVAPRQDRIALWLDGQPVPDHVTVAEAGISPFQFVYVDYA